MPALPVRDASDNRASGSKKETVAIWLIDPRLDSD
jgi:hypothetical protein